MMHFDLSCGFATDTAGFSQLGAGSYADERSHDIHVYLFSPLKSQFAFGPIAIQVEADGAVCFPSCSFEGDGQSFPKALEDLCHREFVFLRQRLC